MTSDPCALPELYHSTPETQTDEAYNHPEDDEHFANHEHIEAEEERRERGAQAADLAAVVLVHLGGHDIPAGQG